MQPARLRLPDSMPIFDRSQQWRNEAPKPQFLTYGKKPLLIHPIIE